MIQLLGVTHRYPRRGTVLDEVTLTVEPGELVLVTGPSGAGKTTLLRLLVREETATEGRVLVFGRDVARLSEREVSRYRREVGFVFQDFRLLPDRTVLENLTFVLRALGTPRADRERRAFEALARFGLHQRLRSLPAELSGGEQQRVAMARALIDRPRLVLADEPTASLDPEEARSALGRFREASSRGATVIIATHDTEVVQSLRRRLLVLEGGRLVSDGVAS